MIWISLGRWSLSSGRYIIRVRIYWRGYKWTPFVRIKSKLRQIDTERMDWKRWCLDAEWALGDAAEALAEMEVGDGR